ncbi:MAG: hypothetical protein JXJ20_13810 [Anaerolineae bacterium]|nr:hypothetical protein [Anaerolineae bacterium]
MRHHRLLDFLATFTVISVGLVTLIGLLSERGSAPASIADFMVQLVTVIAAVAVLIGILNLISVHLGRFVRAEHGWPYSLVVLVVAVAVIALRILDRADIWSGELEGEQVSLRVFEAVQVSLESALAAIILFSLVYAAYRLLRHGATVWNVLFGTAAVIVLLGWIPLENLDVLGDVRDWLVRVPVSAGTRGILIGVGLGTVTVGIRVLIGQDRSYRS